VGYFEEYPDNAKLKIAEDHSNLDNGYLL
jgi:hypothetical protein